MEILTPRKPGPVPKASCAPTNVWAAFFLSGAGISTAPTVRYNLADAMGRMGASEQAILEATEATRLKPDDFAANLKLGKALAQQETFHEWRHDESIEFFRKSIQLKPDLAERTSSSGRRYSRTGEGSPTHCEIRAERAKRSL